MNTRNMNHTTWTRILIAIALVVTCSGIITVLTSCGPSDEERITQALTTEFDAIKNHDDSFIASFVSEDAKQALQDTGIDPDVFISSFLDGFDYTIESIDVEKDKATAAVSITCKSLSDVTNSLKTDADDNTANGTGVNLTEEQIAQSVSENALSYLQEAQPKQHDPVTVELELKDKTWQVSPQIQSDIEQLLLQ